MDEEIVSRASTIFNLEIQLLIVSAQSCGDSYITAKGSTNTERTPSAVGPPRKLASSYPSRCGHETKWMYSPDIEAVGLQNYPVAFE
jgi:hypothetical protein